MIATFEYDRLDRVRKVCANLQSNCHVFSYLGDSDWLSTVRDEVGNLRYRYLYANGRPLRVDIPYVWWVNPWYFVYTARGDYAGFIDKEKSNALTWSTRYGAWGDMSFQDGAYYTWNAEWGYMQFPSSLIAVPGDVLEGFYYAHGRWYMADIGLWFSPWEAGDYLYRPSQNPVNYAEAPPCDNFATPALAPIGGAIVDWIPNPNVDPVTFPIQEAETIKGLRTDILASARNHNTPQTNMDDSAFAALMTSILHWEGRLEGNMKDQTFALLHDVLPDQIVYATGMGNPTTGIANLRPSTALEILRGQIPGLSGNYCYQVSGGKNLDQVLHQSIFTGASPLAITFYDLQDKKIALEYMAINLERGADRINGLNRQASVFNLATWYNGGAQTVPELRNASDSVRGYGNTMLRTMPYALDLLYGSPVAGRYLPYNQDELEFIAPNLLKP